MSMTGAGSAAGHGMIAKLCVPGLGIQPAGIHTRSARAQAISNIDSEREARNIAAALVQLIPAFQRDL